MRANKQANLWVFPIYFSHFLHKKLHHFYETKNYTYFIERQRLLTKVTIDMYKHIDKNHRFQHYKSKRLASFSFSREKAV